jgi:RNA polymerase sigma factor (sigma-70 family)
VSGTENQSETTAPQGGWFASTHWTIVLAAADESSPAAAAALEKLCRTYWYPLYAYSRRRGYGPEDAQDLTQEFFSRLLQNNLLGVADRSKGRFRSFLLGCLEHFLAKEWRRANRQKRGGGVALLSLDAEHGEDRFRLESADPVSADKLYDRRWAITVIETALAALREEYQSSGKTALYQELKGLLSGEAVGKSYAEIACRLAMTEGAVKVAVHRLRQRYGELLRAEVANTVTREGEIDDEVRFLFSALEG